MKRRNRTKALLAALVCGTVLQFGSCISAAGTVILATLDFCALLGPDCTLGPIAPCGDPTTAADDLLTDCPPPPDDTGG